MDRFWKPHFERAIAIVGSQTKLARAIGCSQQKISWLRRIADRVSAEDACAIERVTNGAVPKDALRPDLFGSRGAPCDR